MYMCLYACMLVCLYAHIFHHKVNAMLEERMVEASKALVEQGPKFLEQAAKEVYSYTHCMNHTHLR